MKKTFFTLIMIAFVSGCTGMKMVESDPSVDGASIQPITAALINQLAAKQQTDRAALSADLGSSNKRDYQYRVEPQDVLNITVWDHPELTIPQGQFRNPDVAGNLVFKDGTIYFPYVGYIQVAGKTMPEIQGILTEGLSETLQDPQVSVTVANYRSQRAYVVGEVNSPGPRAITDVPMTIVDAITLAGDTTKEADLTKAALTRNDVVYEIDLLAIYQDGDPASNVLLQDGDVLHLSRQSERKVFVMGETSKQMSMLIDQNRRTTTLTEALADVGGVDQITSNPGKIFVLRGTDNPEEKLIYHINAKSPDALILADHFQLQARDLVYVGTAGVTRWSRVVSQILPGQLVNLGRTFSN